MTFPQLWPALPWLVPYFTLPRLARGTPDLSNAPPGSGRTVSIVIPARDESATLETVLRSLLASEYPKLEIIVVDDRSSDDTAAIAERIAGGDPRVRLVRGAELPAGWFGKPWACVQGYRAAAGELVAFTDADTRHEPDFLGHAVGALEAERADLVTVAAHQRCDTFWERVVMPQIWLLLGLRYNPERVNRATRARDVIANGQFLLVTRAGYEAAGTHQSVRGEVAEDVALAQEFLRHGRKLHLAYAGRLIETRMYRGLAHLIEGWSKNFYLGGRRSFPEEPVLRALMPWLLAGVMGFWLAPVVVALCWALGGSVGGLGPAALAAAALTAGFWALMSFGMGIPPIYGLAYPLGAAMVLYIAARSTWRGARHVEWKGRVYRTDADSGAA
ncbi:MAG TPA: glycosyltransferase family 2 protein [Gemmatimonadales bacterium]|nr:glycosyltransferase family 2 protein [Gemmatimonadales bacterium]